MLNEDLIANDEIISVKKEVEYLICTKNQNGDCIILVDKKFNDFLETLREARNMLKLIATGDAFKTQTRETRAHIAKNMYVGERTKIISISKIKPLEKV